MTQQHQISYTLTTPPKRQNQSHNVPDCGNSIKENGKLETTRFLVSPGNYCLVSKYSTMLVFLGSLQGGKKKKGNLGTQCNGFL